MAKKIANKIDLGAPQLHSRADREIAFLCEKYLEQHPDEMTEIGNLDPDRVVDWAFKTGIYRPKPSDPRMQLRRRVSRHFGHRYMTDPQGDTVRALIAVPAEEVTATGTKRRNFRYYPLFQTEPEKIDSGLQLRLGWAYKRVEQIVTDHQSYIRNNIFGATLKDLDLDFATRVLESSMPDKYPDGPPDDHDDEDDR